VVSIFACVSDASTLQGLSDREMLTTLFYHGPRVAEVCAQRLVGYIQAEHRLTRQEQAVEHFALIDAIVEGDFLGAASKMREHLDGAHRTKISLFSDFKLIDNRGCLFVPLHGCIPYGMSFVPAFPLHCCSYQCRV
jgi:hypothetical protein